MTTVSSTSSLLSASTSTSSSSSTTSTSDIDWSGLIEEAVQAKLSKADSIDLKITANEAKIAAYEGMQALLQSVASAAQALRAPSGTSLSSSDVFKARAAYLSANGSVDAASTVAATVTSGATTGSYDLKVTQLAKAHKVASAEVASQSDDLGYAGTISLGVDADSLTDISITADMSLAEVAEAINYQKSTTGVQASILKISATQYQLVLSSTATGETITATAGSGDDVLSALGLVDTEGAFASVLQESAQAIFSIDGIAITRSTNDVSDVINGVTLHLYQETPDGTSVTVEVGTDLSAVKTAVQTLVDAYNEYRDFALTQQTATSDDSSNVLFGDSTLRAVNSALATALGAIVDDKSLSLLGLSYDSSNRLVVDEDVLDNSLLSNLEEVQALLTFQMTSSSSSLMLLARGTSTPADFTLDITMAADGTIASASVDGDSSLFTISGTRIVGTVGTDYEGYTLVFAGTSSTSIDVSFSTGLAEQLYNASNAAGKDGGSLTTLIDNLTDLDDTLQTKSDDIRSRAETYRTNITARYAQYQAAISAAESSLTYLTQLIDTWNASS